MDHAIVEKHDPTVPLTHRTFFKCLIGLSGATTYVRGFSLDYLSNQRAQDEPLVWSGWGGP